MSSLVETAMRLSGDHVVPGVGARKPLVQI